MFVNFHDLFNCCQFHERRRNAFFHCKNNTFRSAYSNCCGTQLDGFYCIFHLKFSLFYYMVYTIMQPNITQQQWWLTLETASQNLWKWQEGQSDGEEGENKEEDEEDYGGSSGGDSMLNSDATPKVSSHNQFFLAPFITITSKRMSSSV